MSLFEYKAQYFKINVLDTYSLLSRKNLTFAMIENSLHNKIPTGYLHLQVTVPAVEGI